MSTSQAGTVILVETGAANTASVRAAFGRIGVRVESATAPSQISEAAAVVLPGVGAFGAGAASLTAQALKAPLRTRIERGRPTLAVCLGMQLLAERSEESPDVAGLGVLGATSAVQRFSGGQRVPQIGWNHVVADPGAALMASGVAYYANSYRLSTAPAGWTAAWSTYGTPFVAALERGPVLACQFHPELSGAWGMQLLARWWEAARC